MALTDKKINAFTKPVAALADNPKMSAQELKEWFDSNSTNEVKSAINGLIDELVGSGGSYEIGDDTYGEDGNIGESIKKIRGEIQQVIMGQIPDGSIGEEKLEELLQLKIAEIENKAKNDLSDIVMTSHDVTTKLRLTTETAAAYGLDPDTATVDVALNKVSVTRIGDLQTSTNPSPPSEKYVMFDGRQKLLPEDYPLLYENQIDRLSVVNTSTDKGAVISGAVSDYYWEFFNTAMYRLCKVTQGAFSGTYDILSSNYNTPVVEDGTGAIYTWNGLASPYQLVRVTGTIVDIVTGVVSNVQNSRICADGTGAIYTWNGLTSPYQLVRVTGTAFVNVTGVTTSSATATITADGVGSIYTCRGTSTIVYLVKVTNNTYVDVSGVKNGFTSSPIAPDGTGSVYSWNGSDGSYQLIKVTGITFANVTGVTTGYPLKAMVFDLFGALYVSVGSTPFSLKKVIGLEGFSITGVPSSTNSLEFACAGDYVYAAYNGVLYKIVGTTGYAVTGASSIETTSLIGDGKSAVYAWAGTTVTSPLVRITDVTAIPVAGVVRDGTLSADTATGSIFISQKNKLFRYGKLSASNSIAALSHYTYIKAVE